MPISLARRKTCALSYFWIDTLRHGAYVVHMLTTKRQSVTLTEPQAKFLGAEAKKLGITTSDLIRRIIDRYREEKPIDWRAL
jgi:hypothetical protein